MHNAVWYQIVLIPTVPVIGGVYLYQQMLLVDKLAMKHLPIHDVEKLNCAAAVPDLQFVLLLMHMLCMWWMN